MAAEQPNSIDVAVTGMTCAHCEIVVERLIRAMPGVRQAHVDYRTGPREDRRRVRSEPGGARCGASRGRLWGARCRGRSPAVRCDRGAEAVAAIAFVFAVVLLARRFDLMPHGVIVSEHMTLGLVFVIGLVASVSSCMAVTGGLLVALAAKYNEVSTGETGRRRFLPHVYFNVGRIVSYTCFGALIGLVGSAFMLTPMATAILTVTASALMIGIGLQMLGIVAAAGPARSDRAKGNVAPYPRSGHLADEDRRVRSGCSHVFSTLRLYAGVAALRAGSRQCVDRRVDHVGLCAGNVAGACSLSAALQPCDRARTDGLSQARRRVGDRVGASQHSVRPCPGRNRLHADHSIRDRASRSQHGEHQARQVQVVEMTISGLAYRPNRFTVKAGIPVEWRIDGRDAEGCGRILVARGD